MWVRGRGDTGYTKLVGGDRVPKYDDHPETYGTVDETTSQMGFARALSQNEKVRAIIYEAQQDLHLLMSDLAAAPQVEEVRITAEDVDRIDRYIDEMLAEVGLPDDFIVPGATPASAALDVARTIARRAERGAARMLHQGTLRNAQAYRYLNRLSSLLYTLARYEEGSQGLPYQLVSHREPIRIAPEKTKDAQG